MSILSRLLPAAMHDTLLLRTFGFTRIPLLFYARPSVVARSREQAIIRIVLRRKTMNHHRSMYFPVLAIGADCAVGLLAIDAIARHGQEIGFIFRDFHAEFYRRATGDVHFTCNQGNAIEELVRRAANSGEREQQGFEVSAIVPAESEDPVASFRLTLSLKRVQG